MKKMIFVAAMAALVYGCGSVDRTLAHWTGDGSETCHKGVTYLQFTSGATIMVDREGKPVPC